MNMHVCTGCVNLHANKQQNLGIFCPDTRTSLIGQLRRSKLPAQRAFDLGCGLYLGIHPNDDLCRSCVLSLHREVGSVRQYTLFSISVCFTYGCCSASTRALTFRNLGIQERRTSQFACSFPTKA